MTKYRFDIMRQDQPEDARNTFLAMKRGDEARYHRGTSLTKCEILSKTMMRLSNEGYVILFQRRDQKAKDRFHVRRSEYMIRRTAKPTRRNVVEQIFNRSSENE